MASLNSIISPQIKKIYITKIKTSGETQQFDYPLKIKGKKLYFNAKISAIKYHSGNPTEFIAVVRDITHRKKAEKKELLTTDV